MIQLFGEWVFTGYARYIIAGLLVYVVIGQLQISHIMTLQKMWKKAFLETLEELRDELEKMRVKAE